MATIESFQHADSYSQAYPIQFKKQSLPVYLIILPLGFMILFLMALSIVWQRNLVYHEDAEIEHLIKLSDKIRIENKQLKKEILEYSTFHYIEKMAKEELDLELIPISKKIPVKTKKKNGF
ncbi:MAG: cell division protein FtsL [Candidatus Coatesbacteria bacterium]|nr:cell division protein FtsL [Candidatus Coatesbacteria bacterium]